MFIMVSLTHVHHGQSDSCSSWSVWLMFIMVSLTHVHHGQSDSCSSWSVRLMFIMVSQTHVHHGQTHVHHGQSDSCSSWLVWLVSIMVSQTCVHHGQSDLCPPWFIMVSLTLVHHGQSDLCLSWSVCLMSIYHLICYLHLIIMIVTESMQQLWLCVKTTLLHDCFHHGHKHDINDSVTGKNMNDPAPGCCVTLWTLTHLAPDCPLFCRTMKPQTARYMAVVAG